MTDIVFLSHLYLWTVVYIPALQVCWYNGTCLLSFYWFHTLYSNLIYNKPELSFFNIHISTSSAVIDGLFEITKGTISISKLAINQNIKTILCSTLIAFGGFCTLLQSMAFVKNFCSFGFMLLQKTTHALFSCVVSVILVAIF